MAASQKSGEDVEVKKKEHVPISLEKNESLKLGVMSAAMKPEIDAIVANGDQASTNKDLKDHPEACIKNGISDLDSDTGDNNVNSDLKKNEIPNELNGKMDATKSEDKSLSNSNSLISNGAIGNSKILKDDDTSKDGEKSKSLPIIEREKRSRSNTPTRMCRLKEEGNNLKSETETSSRESTPLSAVSSSGATLVSNSSRDNTPVPQSSSRSSTPGFTVPSENQTVNPENIQAINKTVLHLEQSDRSSPALDTSRSSTPVNRSSEERSVDSDSSSSKQTGPKMPKARKSAMPSKPLSLKSQSSNVTVKLPDFENPIKLDTKTLEKISMLGKSHDHKLQTVNSNVPSNKSKHRKIGACTSKAKTDAKNLKNSGGSGDVDGGQKIELEGGEKVKGKIKGTKMDLESDETIKKLSKVESKRGHIGMRSARKIKRLGRTRLKNVGLDSPKKNKKTKRKIFSKKFGDDSQSEDVVDSNTESSNASNTVQSVTASIMSPVKVSSRVKKRRKKMGQYKLPNEIKKKAAVKKKDDRKYDSDCSEGSILSEGKKLEERETNENVEDMEARNNDSMLTESDADASLLSADTGISESDTSMNESRDDSVSNSSQSKKPVWEIFKRTKMTPTQKFPFGSNRKFNPLKKSPTNSPSLERRRKTIAEYMMNREKMGLSGIQVKTEGNDMNFGIESTTDELDGLNDKRGVRKRKKEDEEEMNTSLGYTEVDIAAGKKKKTEQLVHHLTRPLLSTSQQPSLQKTVVNPMANFQPTISVSSINSGTVVTSSKLIFTMAQPTTTNINNVTTNKPPQFLLLTNNQGSSTLLQQLPVFPTSQINKPPLPSGFIQQVPVPVPIMPPQVAMVANPSSSSGGMCLLNNQLALDHNLVSVNANKYNTDNKVELVDSSRPVLSSLLAAPPDFSPYPDRESSLASENSSYPVTPPRTPDDQQSEADSVVSIPTKTGIHYVHHVHAQLGPTPPDKDIIPLCCCKINGASFKKLGSSVTYCQALDSIDGKVMGCCNKVTNYQLVRPGVKIPFMAVCEAHRKRLRLHQCCPGCGHFCTQGKFNQCKKDSSMSVHHFHHECQVIRDSKHYCPHCGEVSGQVEVTLTLEQPRNNSVFEDKCGRGSSNRARMGPSKPSLSKDKENIEELATVSYKLSDKIISTGGIPLGPDKYSLERVLNGLKEERPRKYKAKCLYNPAYEGDLERVVFMLADGFSPNEIIEDFDNQTPLHAAALCGNLAIVHVLVQAGGNIHTVDKELKTPLMYAAENNHLEVTKYLLKAGAQVDTRAEDGMTVLHYASKAGHVDIVRCLLDTDDIKIDVQDDGGWTPIIWASEHKFVDAVKYLIKRGADANLKDKEENTALHWAAFSGSVDIAEIFLNAGCDVESPNEHGDRPLHIAARQDHYECVVLFLARGADVEAKNNENESAIGCCLDENSQVCLALKVNRQLRGFATKSFCKVEKLVHRDVSMGRENIPIAVINGEDDEPLPNDFQYITENCETSSLNINRVITSLQSCRCSDDCSSMFCVCGRNSIKCWFNKEMRLLPDFNMLEPPLIFECNKGCRCWSTCNNRVVQMGITCRLQIFRTNGRGWGVKTLLDIPRGTFVCEYIGELISDSEADSREDDSYLFDLDNRDGDTYCIDARKYGNISRFINHLCEPNLIPVKVFVDHQDLRFPRICFFSSREIKAHEELGFDYGEKFWIIKWKQFTCACGSDKCKYSTETIQKTLEDYRLRHEDDEAATQE